MERVPVARAVAEQERRRPDLPGRVALVEPGRELVGQGAGRPSRSAHARAVGSRWGHSVARRATTRSGSGWAK